MKSQCSDATGITVRWRWMIPCYLSWFSTALSNKHKNSYATQRVGPLSNSVTLNVIYFNPNASYLGWSKGAAVKLGLLQYLPHPYQLVWNFKRVKPAITVFFSNLFLPPAFHYQSHIWIVISCYCNICKCSVQLRFEQTCAPSKYGNNIVTTASFQWEENIVRVFHYLGRYLCKSILVQFVSYMCYVFTTQLTTFFL